MLNLVTGATGLIGSNLVEALTVRGEHVRALVRPSSRAQRLAELGVEVRIGSLSDNATLMAATQGVDRVFHCAALVRDWGTVPDFEEANVHGVRNMLAAATRAKVSKFVFMSTSDVYGFPGQAVDETERPSPRGFPYSDTKVDGESLVWNHYRRVKLPVTVLRPATVYGPGAQLMVNTLVTGLQKRQITLIDEGEHIAGLTYVGNLVDALLLVADSEQSIGQAYNDAFVQNWEYYPLSKNEITFLVDNLMTVANPRLIKVITHGEDVIGFLFAFPDLSAALQRARGRLLPLGIVDLLLELRRTRWVALNGAGILPQFQGRGGNALLYSEIDKTVREFGFLHADLTQVAETAVQMRRDLENLGGKPYKTHRVYTRRL